MEEEVINLLADEIVEKFKKIFFLKEDMDRFIKSNISTSKKEKVLEQLYLFQLYSNAYIGPDPRGRMRLLTIVPIILKSTTEEEIDDKLKILKGNIEFFKLSEINPIETARKIIEDKEKYKGDIF